MNAVLSGECNLVVKHYRWQPTAILMLFMFKGSVAKQRSTNATIGVILSELHISVKSVTRLLKLNVCMLLLG